MNWPMIDDRPRPEERRPGLPDPDREVAVRTGRDADEAERDREVREEPEGPPELRLDPQRAQMRVVPRSDVLGAIWSRHGFSSSYRRTSRCETALWGVTHGRLGRSAAESLTPLADLRGRIAPRCARVNEEIRALRTAAGTRFAAADQPAATASRSASGIGRWTSTGWTYRSTMPSESFTPSSVNRYEILRRCAARISSFVSSSHSSRLNGPIAFLRVV